MSDNVSDIAKALAARAVAGAATPPLQTDPLALRSLADVATALESGQRREWDVQGIVVHGQHGVEGSVSKAGKGWDVIDLSVSIASGTPWLGRFACPNPGLVALYPGEEDDHELKRRFSAVAQARGLDWRELPIHIAQRTPRLARPEELECMRRELGRLTPRMTILDPAYHAAAGGDQRNLFKMGELLAEASDITRSIDSSLLAVWHYNRNQERSGSDRFTGAGPAEWGRFLIAAEAPVRRLGLGFSEVTRRFEVTGTSIAGLAFVATRTITEEIPGDLNSPLTYQVKVEETVGVPPGLSFPEQRVWRALGEAEDPRSVQRIGDALAGDGLGKPYKRNTISENLNKLADRGLADCATDGAAKVWWRLG